MIREIPKTLHDEIYIFVVEIGEHDVKILDVRRRSASIIRVMDPQLLEDALVDFRYRFLNQEA